MKQWHGLVTLSSPVGAVTPVCPEGMYFNVKGASNLIIGMEAISVSGTPTVKYETAFVPAATGDWATIVGTTPITAPASMIVSEISWDAASMARPRIWLRWEISLAAGDAVTFRTFVLAKQGG